jgi:hypothetical protein
MVGQPTLDQIHCADAEYDIAVHMRLVRDQLADHIGAHHLFVYGIGFDVFGVEPHARIGRTHPRERLDKAA